MISLLRKQKGNTVRGVVTSVGAVYTVKNLSTGASFSCLAQEGLSIKKGDQVFVVVAAEKGFIVDSYVEGAIYPKNASMEDI